MNSLPSINPKEEVSKISVFIKDVFKKQNIQQVVIALSGGVDSGASLALLSRSIPKENILALHMPYFKEDDHVEDLVRFVGLPEKSYKNLQIEKMVNGIIEELDISEDDKLRRGNIGVRVRMIILYDFAKKVNGLVCGTENRSENLLGYYTRFGDEASDLEPILHLYKTQVYELAKYLDLPSSILNKPPAAGLWETQTDEEELGFSYKEADPVLYLYFDRNKSI
ncbi:MAG: NAD(+) synthase, partial [Patescibacteria group bacterium]